jgi:hypothetical protein
MAPTFEVQQGVVHVNSIELLRYNCSTVCFCVNFRQKYPIAYGTIEGNGLELHFYNDENTLGVDDYSAGTTEIKVSDLPIGMQDAKLHIAVQMGKYTAYVFIVREVRNDKNRMVWWDKS